MEFDKAKVFTALNADEIKQGSKGYFANSIRILIEENKKLRGQFLELKSKIVDLIYSDENCLDKIIELLDDFELELEEDEE